MPTAAPPKEAFHLDESVSLAIEEGATTVFDADGCVPIHIIRPGIGKGRGRHLYEASMLQRDAGNFTNWRMYVDHLSPEARRAAGGLPRSVRDYGGRIVESWWDPSVPADPQRGYGQGAVMGRAKPAPFIRELIDNDPAAIEASISASATGVKPVSHHGQRVWMVEGIADRGSVDWVTEAGAGGRVAPLIEAAYSSQEAVDMALLESMTDAELAELIREERPGLTIAEAESPAAADEKDKDKKVITESEEDDMPLTPEALQEALSAHPEVLTEALKSTDLQSVIDARVQEALTEEKEAADAERDAVIARQWELRDMRDEAAKLIRESKLPERWQAGLLDRYTLREDRSPAPALDVVAEMDDSGSVTKTALALLREAVTADIATEREKLAEVKPTRVRGQGPTDLKEGETAPEGQKQGEKPYWQQMLEESGVDTDKAYAQA